jgi:hypothetical protein
MSPSRWDPAPLDGGVDDRFDDAPHPIDAAVAEELEREELWTTFGKAAKAFAHVEGWSAVLNAIARAMREDAREQEDPDAARTD